MPGTKLVEERLAEIFGVSRARVREVLARLAHEQIVELYPQRGAFVAKPSIEQALDVFEARRLIEPAVLRRLVDTLTPEKVARLRQHHELEVDARRRDDKRAVDAPVGRVPCAAGRAGRQLRAGAQHARAVDADLPDRSFSTTRPRPPAAAPTSTRRSSTPSPSATRRAPRS